MALSNSQFQAILREYERVQAENRNALKKRKEEIYARIPELAKIEQQAAISALSRLKRGVRERDASVTSGFSEEIAEIERKKEKLLREAGYDKHALEMQYQCADCMDTGLIEGKKCHCFHGRAVKMLYENSGLERVFQRGNFQNFSTEWYDDRRILDDVGMTERAWMEQIAARCKSYIEHFGERRESLLLQGNTGVGKTFLSNCIAKELLEQGYAVICLTAIELFDCLAKVRIEKTENLAFRELYEYIFNCDLLIVDDLGTEVPNAFSASQLFYLISTRLDGGAGTVISTNLSMRKLRDLYSDRTTSRITSGYDILMFYGDDIRARKRMKEMGI